MQHHSQQMIMMLLINLDDNIKWRYGSVSDMLVWRIGLRKVRIFWSIIHYSTIFPCPLDKCDRIMYTIENDILYHSQRYMFTSAHQMKSHIVQLHSCHHFILFHMDMLIHCPTRCTIHSISDSTSICDEVVWCFPKVYCVCAICLNMLKQTSIISHDSFINQYSTFDFKVTWT